MSPMIDIRIIQVYHQLSVTCLAFTIHTTQFSIMMFLHVI